MLTVPLPFQKQFYHICTWPKVCLVLSFMKVIILGILSDMLLSLNHVSKIHPCWLVCDVCSWSQPYHRTSDGHATPVPSPVLGNWIAPSFLSYQQCCYQHPHTWPYARISLEQSFQLWLYMRIIQTEGGGREVGTQMPELPTPETV